MTSTRTTGAAPAAPQRLIFVVGDPNLWVGMLAGDDVAAEAMDNATWRAVPAPNYGAKPSAAKAEDNDPESVQARIEWAAHVASVKAESDDQALTMLKRVYAAQDSGELHVVIAHGATGNGGGYPTVANSARVQGFVMALSRAGKATLHVLPANTREGSEF